MTTKVEAHYDLRTFLDKRKLTNPSIRAADVWRIGPLFMRTVVTSSEVHLELRWTQRKHGMVYEHLLLHIERELIKPGDYI